MIMRHAPITIIILLLIGIGAQAIPIFGLLAMALIGIWWVPFFTNMFVLVVGYRAVIGGTSRIWLAVPIIFYGGYGLVMAWSHLEFQRFDREFRHFNAGKAIPFDPKRHAIVVEGSQGTAQALVNDYNAPVAYSLPGGGSVQTPQIYCIADETACK